MERKYVTSVLSIEERGGAVEANCRDIHFTNYGDGSPTAPTGANLVIDDVIVVYPGCTYEVRGDVDELNVSKYKLTWRGAGVRVGVVQRRIMV